MKHLQTIKMNTDSIIGKRITYYDGFSGSNEAFKVTEVKFDGNGYEARGARSKDFLFFGTGALKKLIETGRFEQQLTIDGCPVFEIYTIQG